jgi:3'(2'), 5'-bisphosphate nucleotidase
MEWDTAAGHAVLSAAGGRVVQVENKQRLRYGKPNYRNPFFIAASKNVILR